MDGVTEGVTDGVTKGVTDGVVFVRVIIVDGITEAVEAVEGLVVVAEEAFVDDLVGAGVLVVLGMLTVTYFVVSMCQSGLEELSDRWVGTNTGTGIMISIICTCVGELHTML